MRALQQTAPLGSRMVRENFNATVAGGTRPRRRSLNLGVRCRSCEYERLLESETRPRVKGSATSRAQAHSPNVFPSVFQARPSHEAELSACSCSHNSPFGGSACSRICRQQLDRSLFL